MLLLALIFGLFAFPFFAFNVGGTVPGTGTGEAVPSPVPAPSPARGTAKLTLKAVQPVATVVGTGFKPRENVRIMSGTTTRVGASAKGTFTVRLRHADPCNGFTITAVGSKGSRASLQYSQLLCIEP
jgi:hypothetical protein